MGLLVRLLEKYTFRTGKLRGLWVRLAHPNSYKYADFLRLHGGYVGIGPNSRVNWSATITNPGFVRIGANCAVAKADLIGHNGVIGIFMTQYGEKLDSVGKIDIRDNSFIGHGSIILPGVTIGPNSIVAAGSVVSRDVPPDMVVGGVPAKVICSTRDYYERLLQRSRETPWHGLIEQRRGDYDPAMEPELNRLRHEYFYGSGETSADYPGSKQGAS